MQEQELTLYHHGSSACAAKVRFALAEKNLHWKSIYIDILNGEQFQPDYLAVNPKGVVPTLKHDDEIITESTVICEYLEDCFPEPPLYPYSSLAKARVRYWTKAVDEELHPACSALTYIVSHRHTLLANGISSYEDFINTGDVQGLAARKLKWQWLQEGINAPGAHDKIALYVHFLSRMEDALATSDWLVENRFSMADIAMAPYLNRLDTLAMDYLWRNGIRPRVTDWFERIKQRETFIQAVTNWVPDALQKEMYNNGLKSRDEIRAMLETLKLA